MVLLNLGYKASSSKIYCIIESSRESTRVPLVPGHGTSPCQNDKTNKHNKQSQHLFYLQSQHNEHIHT